MHAEVTPRMDSAPSHENIEERCGLTAYYAFNPQKNVLERTIRAAFGVQHRGQKGAGFLINQADGVTICQTGNGLLPDALNETFLPDRPTTEDKWALVHCRYGTSGGWDSANLQPMSPEGMGVGEIAEPVHFGINGQFVLDETLEAYRRDKDESDTVLFTRFFADAPGNDVEEKLIYALTHVKGSYAMLVAVGDKIYMARDPHGNRPLVHGRTEDGILVGSETTIFNHETDEIKDVTFVEQGKLYKLDNDGVTEIADMSSYGENGDCAFETAYFKRPDSQIIQRATGELTTVGRLRMELGGKIAEENEFNPDEIDFVIGMPDSGTFVGAGFAQALRVPFIPVVSRDHYYPAPKRAFMDDANKESIPDKVREKIVMLNDPKIWKGKRVVIGDDSIVRGDTSSAVNKILREFGVASITWIIGYPQVVNTCHLGVSMRSKDELVAVNADYDPEKIAAAIGADTVYFISNGGFLDVVTGGNTIPADDPKDLFMMNGFCGGCTGGEYPVSEQGVIWRPPNVKKHVVSSVASPQHI